MVGLGVRMGVSAMMTTVLVVNNNPDNLPGRYTQQLISRAREAGLQVREVRSVDAVNALAADLAQEDAGAGDIGLIVSCGSPVVLTEPVDLRAHVAKTTAAMLQFPDVPVVGICYGMQLLTVLYGGRLLEQRESAHRGEWAELRRSHVKSRLLDDIPSKFPQWASNFIFVDQLPPDFRATAVDSANRVMAMEHVEDHVYGLQWHPEVINSKIGRRIMDRIFSLVGKPRATHRGTCAPAAGLKPEPSFGVQVSTGDMEVLSFHEVDLELRKVVKDLIQRSGGGSAAADLGRLLAGRRRELMSTLRSSQAAPRVGTDGDGSLGAALNAASAALREVADAWLLNPAPAG
ncbi:guaA [Symbiodinium pilosum]|uniref:GuaA protein n=1 Tax=Symbiodinium pilosum TaxID=2952 RepID=A0A812P6L2_SYMPI|nr:guaA [Symbiodinium pilosum]